MPELVEVEHFARQLTLLISSKSKIVVECPSKSPPKTFISKQDIEYLQKCFVRKVERKGKLIRLVVNLIDDKDQDESSSRREGMLYFHMGMTGRISTPDHVVNLESLSGDDEYPPPHTHLILKSNGHEIAFSDPRKFGAVALNSNGPLHTQWDDFAVDALGANVSLLSGLIGQKKGIKALLLDQRAVVSGVGNWIADEVLYQSKIHPDQNHLTEEEVGTLKTKLQEILSTGIQCSKKREEFPEDWIFHSRWKKRSKEVLNDKDGYRIQFIQSGGRTSAFVPKIQKKFSRKGGAKDSKKQENKKKQSKRKVNSVVEKERNVADESNTDRENVSAMKRRSSRLAKKAKSDKDD